MDFIYLFSVILKRKWLIISASLLAAVVAYILTINNEKKYSSAAQISTGFTISDDIKLNNDNFNFFEADTKFSNAIVTCTSPTVLSLVSYSLILHDLENPRPFRVLTATEKRSPLYHEIDVEAAKALFQSKLETMSMLTSFNPNEKKMLEYLKLFNYDYTSINKNLNVFRLPHTDYFQIEFISENPNLSAFVVNTTYQQFLRYYTTIRSNKSKESIDTLSSLVEKKKQILDAKNNLLREHGLIDTGQENSSKLELIMKLETDLSEEKNKQTTLNYSLEKLNQKLADLNSTNKTDPATNVNNNNGELLILKKAMNDAYSAYINNGSKNEELLNKYNTLKSQYMSKAMEAQEEIKTPDTKVSAEATRSDLLDKKLDAGYDIKASEDNVTAIQNKIDGLKGELFHDASKKMVVESLLKDAQMANKDYIDVKQRYSDATDISTSSLNNFRQILYGQPAIEPEPSKRLLIVGMSGVSVFIISILTIALLAYLDSSVKTPVLFAKSLNLRLISMVNFMNLKKNPLRDIVSQRGEHSLKDDQQRHNVFRESLRKLRFEIENDGKKIFLFTSTRKGMGKTTLIQALAYSMSLSKKRVLIIDTNFCNNDLTMQLHGEPILEKIDPTDSSDADIIQKVKDVAVDIGVGTVFVIGSEGGDYTPSEILPRENLLKHLGILTKEYDFIFLEGPPLNDFSDAKELAKYVEGVIAVFSATQIIKQMDKESVLFYQELNGKFVGAILNMVDMENVNVT